MLDCFIPNFKLKYEDLQHIKADRVNTFVFNLHQTNVGSFFRTLGIMPYFGFDYISEYSKSLQLRNYFFSI